MASKAQQRTGDFTREMGLLGWSEGNVLTEAVSPPVKRGTNTVVLTPPSPVWATPALAALLSRLNAGTERLLVLAAPAQIADWGATLHGLVGDRLRVEAARGAARAARRIKSNQVDVLVVSPETALALHTRSSLQPDSYTAIVFAWPEDWDADEAILVLLQDLPREAQRVVLTARPDQADNLVERYARKAVRVGSLSAEGMPFGPVRTLPSGWSNRAATLAELLEVADPPMLTVWTVDTRDHAQITAALGGLGEGISIVVQSVPAGGMIVCYDLPEPAMLAELVAAGEVTLMVPPGTEGYVGRIAGPRHPVPTEGAVTALLRRDATTRAAIAQRLIEDDDAALYLLAPLFERHEPQRVAAALYRLWREGGATNISPVAVPDHTAVATTPVGGYRVAKIWVGVGKKDSATVADLVAVLVREVGLDRGLIGRIDLRDTFAIVEVPADEAPAIVERLSGITIRKRKLTAKVDTGRTSPSMRSDERGARPERSAPRGDAPPRRRE